MKTKVHPMQRLVVTVLGAAVVFVGGLNPFAQTPAPTGQTPPPAPAAPAGAQGRGTTPAPAPTQGGFAGGGLGAGRADNSDADFSPKEPLVGKSAAEEAKTFVLPTGYHMELVVSDPDIISPAVIEFDGNGRMYVAEFLTYMPDADGNREHDPINRITRWESTRGDGKYDKRTVFVDKLILPRMVLPLDNNSILTNETDSDDVVKYTDTNNDGVADKKELFYTGVGLGRDGNLEHEQSGFIWGLDNWIYSTYNAFRFRWTPNGILREPTGPNAGQWGLSMDDDGKPWFVDAGGERGPMNFQYPIHYGSFNPPDANEPGFDNVFPIAGVADTQGGMQRVRMPLAVLNHFTATNGPAIVRAHRMPADMQGDLLICEPVGRLIRRAKVTKIEGLTQLKNAYPGSEFILSSDLFFRPVNIRTAPDGTLFIADMYHGIIQESQWTKPYSYLRRKIEQYQMDKVVDRGRIWRLRFDGLPAIPEVPPGMPAAPPQGIPGHPAVPALEPDLTQPRMLTETPAQLVTHLAHPNGWWRDTAQRLLVLKQDKSVVPALQEMVRISPNLVARFHAMWTLEGLGALDAGLAREAMKDPNPRMRIQAVRASETLYKAGNKSFADDYRALTKDSDPDVVIQAMLTLNLFKVSDVADVIKAAQESNKAKGVQDVGRQLLAVAANAAAAAGRGGPVLNPEQQDLMQRGGQIFNELCFTCHGSDGRGQPMAGAEAGTTMGPPLAGSPRVQGHRDYVVKALLNGLSGPIGGKSYTEVMVPLGSNKDEWIAAAASYIRNSFGNSAGFVTPADVARVRAATTSRKAPWTQAELEPTLPKLMEILPAWKASASHSAENAARALTLAGWNTGAPQTTGMWFQVELPAAATIAEIQFDSANVAGARAGAPGTRGGPGGPPVPTSGYPRGYRVQVSMDGKTWGAPVAEGKGSSARTIISFKPVSAKFVRITQTDSVENAPVWSIMNLRLYEGGK
jgi:mono/diheme cytochrome c family protein